MKKKLGPLPTWAWIALLAGVAYLAYRYEKGKSEGVEEGYFPTQGIPAAGAETGASSGGGGVGELGETLRSLEEAGLVPAGSERAEREPRETPAWWEALTERIVGERLGGGQGKRGAAKTKSGKAGPLHRQGKGASTRKGGNKGNGNAGQRTHGNQTNHQPGHTRRTDHRAAAHPATRIAPAVPVSAPSDGDHSRVKRKGRR